MKTRKVCKRWNTPGHAHLLTFTCFHARPFLARDRSRNWFLEALSSASIKHGFHVWAYVVMPNHAHVLVFSPCSDYDVSKLLASIKLPVSRKALAFVRDHAPEFLQQMADIQPDGDIHYRFWQRGGGYDRNLLETDTIIAAIEYIHANPIRKGLCNRADEWSWSSASDTRGIVNRSLMPRM
jgi:putative transposase